MKAKGWAGDPIDVVHMHVGAMATIDNTRIVAAGNAGTDVQAIVHFFDELLPDQIQVDRFTTPEGVPAIWGDATLRIGKQSAGYCDRWPIGPPYSGWGGN